MDFLVDGVALPDEGCDLRRDFVLCRCHCAFLLDADPEPFGDRAIRAKWTNSGPISDWSSAKKPIKTALKSL